MTLAIIMILAYLPFFMWVVPTARDDWKQAQKEMEYKTK